MNLKRILIITFVLVVAVASIAAASPIPIYFDGQEVYSDTPPDMKDGVTLVPVRMITEVMGYDVSWNEEIRQVLLEGQGKTITLYIGNDIAYVNGAERRLLRPAEIINNRTMIPLRFVSEELGTTVEWENGVIRIDRQSKTPITQPSLDESGNPSFHFTLPPNLFK